MSSFSPADVRALPGGGGLPLSTRIVSWLPVAAPLAIAGVIIFLRAQVGETRFLYDGSLIVLALICYLFAAVIGLIEMYADKSVLGKWGLVMAASGLMFNVAAWGTRWIAAGDREGWIRWVFRYVPFANLYDLSIAFSMGAALTTVIICRKREARSVMGIAMLMSALIVMLAIFLGREFIDLPPVLDSYWRPIHVGIASISYGVVLVCFSIAVLYLIKDGYNVEAMGVFVALMGLGIYATINRFALVASGTYGMNLFYTEAATGESAPIPLRATLPGVGPLMLVAAAFFIAALVCFALDLYKENQDLRKRGFLALGGALVAQVASVVTLFYQKSALKGSFAAHVDVPSQISYPKVAEWLGGPAAASSPIAHQQAASWLTANDASLSIVSKSNPVELGAIFTLLALTGLVLLFGFRTERLVERLPSLERLDELMYKTAAVSFTGLAMLLITGAIWANESWGRYWGWDSKETGALVAWLAYAGFLHTRIAHAWTGRRSAYFAIVGFLLVIFTYLGVSYLLPGLHSYA
jgi:cytochrome c-type biogenesis protein CcsB